jgi:hypothetical protein
MKLTDLKNYIITSINGVNLIPETKPGCHYVDLLSEVDADWSQFDTCTAIHKLTVCGAFDNTIITEFYVDTDFDLFN